MRSPLSENARKVLEARYLRRDASGQILETPEALFRRVAHAIAQVEHRYGDSTGAGEWEDAFFDAMAGLEFLPNSPTLMNAGLPLGQLSACFVLPVEDSMADIFDSLKLMALIQQSGGGTGFSFSRLRPKGDVVSSTNGVASGPVSFMSIFDCATEHIKQGGKRRGANIGILRVDHPDIEDFIDAKLDGQRFRNFNISAAAPDAFMEAVRDKHSWELRHPRTGQTVRTVPAERLFERLTRAAWQTGDPGLIFIDAVTRDNPTPDVGDIEATNPCGELPLLPYESCNLASINLSLLVRREIEIAVVDWEKLRRLVRLGVRFLDNVIDVSRWPATPITDITRANRKIGLGVMGFADLLIQLAVPYASEPAIRLAEDLMRFISAEAMAASQQLANERGVFPNWERSVYAQRGIRVRNATRTSIAPTGTISIIAGTSASIEPLFALAYRRHALDGQVLVEINPLLLQYARDQGFYSESFVQELLARGSLAEMPTAPPAAKELFRTALEISPTDHLRVQTAIQRHVDNAVSKTVNLPETATIADVAAIYRQAWEWKCKGITIFRYGSKGRQVLELGAAKSPDELEHFARCDPERCQL